MVIFCSSWDEKRVGEWLRAINCAQYEQLFKGRNSSSINKITCKTQKTWKRNASLLDNSLTVSSQQCHGK